MSIACSRGDWRLTVASRACLLLLTVSCSRAELTTADPATDHRTISGARSPLTAAGAATPTPITVSILPSPDQGACAFVPAASCTPTKNPACPNGVFYGDLIAREARDLSALAGCQRIAGDVVLESETLRDLRGLDAVQVIEGNLLIHGRYDTDYGDHYGSNQLLESLRGLEQLRCVGRNLLLSQGNVCKPLDTSALARLTEVGGALVAHEWCEASPVGSSFASLRRVWGDASISGTASLPNLEQVYGRLDTSASTPKLEYVGCGSSAPMCRDGVLGCSFDVQQQSGLAALQDCRLAVGDLTISGADLVDLQPLAKLREVRGFLGIRDAPNLTSLGGLEGLETAHTLSVGPLSQLQDLTGLSNLRVLRSNRDRVAFMGNGIEVYQAPLEPGDLILDSMPALTDVAGLRSLRHVEGTFSVYDCDELTGIRELKSAALGGLDLRYCDALRSPEGPVLAPKVANLLLVGLPALQDMRGLQTVRDVTDTLAISDCVQLASLNELSSLQRAGNLNISNMLLTTLGGLSGLKRVDNDLQIWGNPQLRTTSALSALTYARDFRIADNPSLANLDGLQKLSRVSYMFLGQLPKLASLAGFSGLREVGDLFLTDIGALKDLQGLSSLTRLDGLYMYDMPVLTSLNGIPQLANGTTTTVQLSNNPALNDIRALARLSGVDGLLLLSNPQLHDLTGLEGITRAGDIVLEGDFSLQPLRGLAQATALTVSGPAVDSLQELMNLRSVGYLTVEGGVQVAPLSGPPALETATSISIRQSPVTDLHVLSTLRGSSEIGVSDNPNLSNLAGLEGIEQSNNVSILGNASLTSLTGLDHLTSAGGMYLFDNPVLADLTALSNLTRLEYLRIERHPLLQSLAGLEQLASLDIIAIESNATLQSLRGLRNAVPDPNALNVSVTIQNNPNLFECEVALLAAQYNVSVPAGQNGPEGTCEP
jgi:hypothetical protein